MDSNMSSSMSRRSSPTALRPLSTTLGSLARADASASFAFGPVEVIASLTGPSEVRIRDELTDRATLDILFQPLHGSAGIPSKSLSNSLFSAFSAVLLLHHYPRSLIQVVLQTLSSPPPSQSSSSAPRHGDKRSRRRKLPLLLGPDEPPSVTEKASLINSASLAILDGGIAARGTVAACSCAILPAHEGLVLRENSHIADISDTQLKELVRQKRIEEGKNDEDMDEANEDTIVLLDPTPTELTYALSTHVFAFSFSGRQVGSSADEDIESEQVFAESLGGVDMEDYERARQLCLEASKSILAFMRQAIEKRVLSQAE